MNPYCAFVILSGMMGLDGLNNKKVDNDMKSCGFREMYSEKEVGLFVYELPLTAVRKLVDVGKNMTDKYTTLKCKQSKLVGYYSMSISKALLPEMKEIFHEIAVSSDNGQNQTILMPTKENAVLVTSPFTLIIKAIKAAKLQSITFQVKKVCPFYDITKRNLTDAQSTHSGAYFVGHNVVYRCRRGTTLSAAGHMANKCTLNGWVHHIDKLAACNASCRTWDTKSKSLKPTVIKVEANRNITYHSPDYPNNFGRFISPDHTCDLTLHTNESQSLTIAFTFLELPKAGIAVDVIERYGTGRTLTPAHVGKTINSTSCSVTLKFRTTDVKGGAKSSSQLENFRFVLTARVEPRCRLSLVKHVVPLLNSSAGVGDRVPPYDCTRGNQGYYRLASNLASSYCRMVNRTLTWLPPLTRCVPPCGASVDLSAEGGYRFLYDNEFHRGNLPCTWRMNTADRAYAIISLYSAIYNTEFEVKAFQFYCSSLAKNCSLNKELYFTGRVNITVLKVFDTAVTGNPKLFTARALSSSHKRCEDIDRGRLLRKSRLLNLTTHITSSYTNSNERPLYEIQFTCDIFELDGNAIRKCVLGFDGKPQWKPMLNPLPGCKNKHTCEDLSKLQVIDINETAQAFYGPLDAMPENGSIFKGRQCHWKFSAHSKNSMVAILNINILRLQSASEVTVRCGRSGLTTVIKGTETPTVAIKAMGKDDCLVTYRVGADITDSKDALHFLLSVNYTRATTTTGSATSSASFPVSSFSSSLLSSTSPTTISVVSTAPTKVEANNRVFDGSSRRLVYHDEAVRHVSMYQAFFWMFFLAFIAITTFFIFLIWYNRRYPYTSRFKRYLGLEKCKHVAVNPYYTVTKETLQLGLEHAPPSPFGLVPNGVAMYRSEKIDDYGHGASVHPLASNGKVNLAYNIDDIDPSYGLDPDTTKADDADISVATDANRQSPEISGYGAAFEDEVPRSP